MLLQRRRSYVLWSLTVQCVQCWEEACARQCWPRAGVISGDLGPSPRAGMINGNLGPSLLAGLSDAFFILPVSCLHWAPGKLGEKRSFDWAREARPRRAQGRVPWEPRVPKLLSWDWRWERGSAFPFVIYFSGDVCSHWFYSLWHCKPYKPRDCICLFFYQGLHNQVLCWVQGHLTQ